MYNILYVLMVCVDETPYVNSGRAAAESKSEHHCTNMCPNAGMSVVGSTAHMARLPQARYSPVLHPELYTPKPIQESQDKQSPSLLATNPRRTYILNCP